jgi:hypothetical protein
MDVELRNSLWNVVIGFYMGNLDDIRRLTNFIALSKRLWCNYFKYPLDTLPKYEKDTYKEIREYFFTCEWYEVYDFIEFVANNYPDDYNQVTPRFIDSCNNILERELSAYRFVGGKITQITSKEEITEIEEALEATEPLKGVNIHLKCALDKLADRKSPDYRNSVKESISAVEAICKLITKQEKATLGEALNKIEDKVSLHPALKNAFCSLYGYTSDADGIRHALVDEPNLDFEDAKFMLVSCSAFVNYLISKASKAGIKL